MSRVLELAPVTDWDTRNRITCMTCDDPFQAGTWYVERAIDAYQEYRDEPIMEAICLPCAFTDDQA